MNIIETNLNFGGLSKRGSTKRIILHHAEAKTCTAADIHRWHKEKGWSGAGYHFLVRKDGKVYRLRPEWAIGAHAQGSNSDSLGICFEGAFNSENMGQTQINAGRELVSYLKRKYGISSVLRHKDVMSTDCPGRNFPFAAVANGTSTTPAPEPSKPVVSSGGNPIIREGQQHCNNFTGAGIPVDGYDGPKTRKGAVKAVQTAINQDYRAGIAVDGIWGPKSDKALGNHYVCRGECQYMVTAVEILLMLKGYNPKGVECPGSFGSGLDAAVRKYQREHGLTADGYAGPLTFKSLMA